MFARGFKSHRYRSHLYRVAFTGTTRNKAQAWRRSSLRLIVFYAFVARFAMYCSIAPAASMRAGPSMSPRLMPSEAASSAVTLNVA